MKTNVTLESKDRELFGVTIKQETKTGFLSVSELQDAYEIARSQYGWSSIDISSLMQSNKMTERIFYLLKDKMLVKAEYPVFMKEVKEQGFVKYLKQIGVWKTTGRGENRTVMCDPYIWVAIALELNPMIYAKVIGFITDSLIFDRIEAGDEFKPMNAAVKTIIQNPNYSQYAIAINERVFGKHYTGMRNYATSEQLKNITRLEVFVINCIEMGFVTDESSLMNAIAKFPLKQKS